MQKIRKAIFITILMFSFIIVVGVMPVSARPENPVNLIFVGDIQFQESDPTAIPLAQVITSTPGENGIIIHTVQYGETLWTIAEAYGVPIDRILQNTGLSLATTEVFEGQELIIQTATDPTPTETRTATPDPGTPTPTQPRPTMTPFPTRTPAPTFTPTPTPSVLHRVLGKARLLGIALLVVSGLGIILVIYLGFLKNPDPPNRS